MLNKNLSEDQQLFPSLVLFPQCRLAKRENINQLWIFYAQKKNKTKPKLESPKSTYYRSLTHSSIDYFLSLFSLFLSVPASRSLPNHQPKHHLVVIAHNTHTHQRQNHKNRRASPLQDQTESAAILKIKESMQEEAKRFEKDSDAPDYFMQ